jgi:ribosomal protein L37AE/L43A
MSVILLEPPTTTTIPATMPDEDQPDHQCRDMNCPVCGSSSTYQTGGGRWGCVQCGSSWG